MDSKNALTAIEPEETRCGSLAVAENRTGEEAEGCDETKGVDHGC